MDDPPLPRLASRVRIDALIRRVTAEGGFAAILARGDDEAGAIAVVTRSRDGGESLHAAVLSPTGRYAFACLARDEMVAGWIERARRRDPDLWVVELDIPNAGQLVDEMLSAD